MLTKITLAAGALVVLAACAAPAAPLTPRTVTLHLTTANPCKALGCALVVPDSRCNVWIPPPQSVHDMATWEILWHELQHCQGWRHN